jgi:hypothetical protein
VATSCKESYAEIGFLKSHCSLKSYGFGSSLHSLIFASKGLLAAYFSLFLKDKLSIILLSQVLRPRDDCFIFC